MLKITAIVIISVFVFGIAASACAQFVYADTSLQQKLDKAKKEKSEAQKKIDNANSEKEKTLETMEKLEKEVGQIQTQLDAINEQLSETEAQLKIKEEELEKATKEADKQFEDFQERFRVMCEGGVVNYIEILFSAESFSDFLDRIEIAQEIAEYDRNIFDHMEEVKNTIENSKNEIEAIKEEQEKYKIETATQKSALSSKLAEQNRYINELQQDIKANEKIMEEKQAAMDALISQISASLSKSTSGGGSSNVKYVGGDFAWPTPSCYTITSHFSPARVNPVSGKLKKHTGTDIGASFGASIVAANSGTVTLAGWNSGYGNCVIIDHGGGRATLYGHMSSIGVKKGQSVTKGQQIGKVGSTGNSTGPHLHFEVLINGSPVNPMQFFN